ncbi:MAG TPA: TIGR02186 family protein [Anaerolineae bacterium]|nr:TIGR02186 family protein [Anaerolineae bacterium]
MRDSGCIRKIIVVAFIMLSSLLIFSGVAFAQLTVDANHSRVKIDILYHGSTVDIKGETDPDADVVVKIVSPEDKSILRKKGKVGILWMNIGTLEFSYFSLFS